MRVDVVTIFPEVFPSYLGASLLGKAIGRGILDVRVHDLRDYATDRHRQVDDEPYGGGPGMVMKPEPFFAAVESIRGSGQAHVVLLSPQGRVFSQAVAREFARLPRLVLLCGRYEGVDQRVGDDLADEELSVGDYVLGGGEVAAMAVLEATARLVPGVVGEPESVAQDSFEDGLLDHPHYTRPPSFQGLPVPEVLLSGDHGAIAAWRRSEALRRTRERRPDLTPDAGMS